MRLRAGVKRDRKKRERRWMKKGLAERERALRDSVPRVLPGEICLQGREHCKVLVIGQLVPAKLPVSSKDFVFLYLPKMMGSRGTLVCDIKHGEYSPQFSKYYGNRRNLKNMEMVTFFVPVEWRRRGNGGKLLDKAIAIAGENNAKVIWTKTSVKNFNWQFQLLLHRRGFALANWPDRQGNAIFEKVLSEN